MSTASMSAAFVSDFSTARANLVENQVRCNGVTDLRVISAISEIPRELFVPEESRSISYVDDNLRVATGRYLLHARVFAKLCQAAEITETDKILDVGCATGYSSAVLSRLGASVTALEEDAALAVLAETNLGPYNANVVTGSLNKGYSGAGPYNVILLNGSVPYQPAAISEQLAEGGRLVTVIGERPVGQGYVFVRSKGEVSGRAIFDASVPLLPGFEVAETFVF